MGPLHEPPTTPMPPQFIANKRVHYLYEHPWLGDIVVSGQWHLEAAN